MQERTVNGFEVAPYRTLHPGRGKRAQDRTLAGNPHECTKTPLVFYVVVEKTTDDIYELTYREFN
jgi:hypothetical protein